MEINEELLEIVIFWYEMLPFKITPNCLLPISNLFKMSSALIHELWINKWFAKEDAQKAIDITIKNRFSTYIDKYVDYEPRNICETIAIIILYDQFTRNIFRHTKNAYEFDHIAQRHNKTLIEHYDNLPFCVKLTHIICFVHSEQMIEHEYIQNKIATIGKDTKCSFPVYMALVGITNNHRERIEMFHRIPERNVWLGRISTQLEKIYLDGIY